MTELRQVNKKEFLLELKNRMEKEEIIILMRSYLLKEEQEWKKTYELVTKDKEREKEADAWTFLSGKQKQSIRQGDI